MNSSTSDNPFEAPLEAADAGIAEEFTPELKQVTFANALMRWLPICAISGGPSFVFGIGCSTHQLEIPLMLLGIALFAIGYAYLDISPRWRRWMSRPVTRKSIIGGYALRMICSVLYPIAAVNDLLVGLCSVSAVGFVFQGKGNAVDGQMSNPLQILVTTLVQGILLNLEVFFVVLVLIGFARMWGSFQKPRPTIPA